MSHKLRNVILDNYELQSTSVYLMTPRQLSSRYEECSQDAGFPIERFLSIILPTFKVFKFTMNKMWDGSVGW